MSGDPILVVAETLHDQHHNDLSVCPYFQGTGEKSCVTGCYDEPHCHTDRPIGGWLYEVLRARYPHLIEDDDEVFGEPTNLERLDAAAVLIALREAGWRIVRTESVRPTWVERTERIAEEWTP